MSHTRVLCLALTVGAAFCVVGDASAEAAPSTSAAQAADPVTRQGQVIRTVRIDIGSHGFHPLSVTVRAGETVRFVLHNTSDREPHEFTVGTAAMHQGRRELIEEMSASTPIETRIQNFSPYDAPNAVVVLPGETRELVWTFTSTKRFEFACNIPNHSAVRTKGAFRLLAAGDNELDFPAVDRASAVRLAVKPEAPVPFKQSLVSSRAPHGHEKTGAGKRDSANAYRTGWRVVESDAAETAGKAVFSAPTPSGRPEEEGGTTELVRVGDGVFGFTQSNAPQSHGTPEIEGVSAREFDTEQDIDEVTRLGKGHELLAKGQVVEARKLYTISFEAGLLEAAFALGRSYDPRTVSMLDEPDAEPDQDKARHWYQEWYRRSVEEGAVSDAVKLDILIKGMDGG